MCARMIEPERRLEQRGRYDVVVAGGGMAGVAAALSAARQGAKVQLIEKQYMLGGLATAGLVTIYLPLCDGMGRQVSFSIAEELLRLSIRHGAEARYPSAWLGGGDLSARKSQRFQVRYNANVCAILMEQLLLENGVELLYGTAVCAAQVVDGKIRALVVENKSGRYAVGCKSVVDATGDADVACLAGAETEIFAQKNSLAGWYYFHDAAGFHLKQLGFADVVDKDRKPEDAIENLPKYTGLDAQELTRMTVDSHRLLLDDFLKDGPISPDHALTAISAIPQVRMTRRLSGVYTLDDAEAHKPFADSVGLIGNWRQPGPVYALPFGTLYGKEVKNLICAGRCISVTDTMWDISRVIPACAVTGEAAGAAAALTDDFTVLPVNQLHTLQTRRGVVLHDSDM